MPAISTTTHVPSARKAGTKNRTVKQLSRYNKRTVSPTREKKTYKKRQHSYHHARQDTSTLLESKRQHHRNRVRQRRVRPKRRSPPQKAGARNKCSTKRLDDLLAGNPPVTFDQEMPKQSISAGDFAGYNAKGLGKTPGPPPKLPSGCIIL